MAIGSYANNTPGRPAMGYDFGQYGGLEDYIKRLQTTQGPKQLFRGMAPGLGQEIGFFNESTFGRLGALRNAFEALDPSNLGNLSDAYTTNALGQAQGLGRRTANTLFKQFGSQPGLQAGAELSASNRALSDAGQFRSQIFSPFNLANMYLGQASALSGANTFQGLPFALQALGMSPQKQQGGGFLDTLTGLAGTAFGGGWSPF